MLRNLLRLLPCMVLAACAFEVAEPRTEFEGLPDGLDAKITVEPGVVAPHAPFEAHFRMTNTTTDTIHITTSHGCLVTFNVIRKAKSVPLEGSSWACTAAITTHSIAPGETWERAWTMRAELYAVHPGDKEGAPAPQGSYIIQAVLGTGPSDGAGSHAVAEALLRVK